jgi:hypothetical protein
MESSRIDSVTPNSTKLEPLNDDNSQQLELQVIDSQSLQQLQNEIKQEINELLKNSKVSQILKKYGVSGQKILTVQSSLDLSQYKLKENITSALSTQSSTENFPTELTPIETSFSVFYNPCLGPDLQPHPDYPDGCWVG